MNREVREEDVAQLAEVFAGAGSSASNIHLAPYARATGDIHLWLREAGYALLPTRPTWAKFIRGTEACTPVATELEIVPATHRDAEALATVLSAAHGMPPSLAAWTAALVDVPEVRLYRALDGDTLVGELRYSQGAIGLGSASAACSPRIGVAVPRRRSCDNVSSTPWPLAPNISRPKRANP